MPGAPDILQDIRTRHAVDDSLCVHPHRFGSPQGIGQRQAPVRDGLMEHILTSDACGDVLRGFGN